MKYELKFVHPIPMLINSARVFLVLGFVFSIITFFIVPNPSLAAAAWWQKILGSLVFTLVYGVVVAMILGLIAVLYNLFAGKFKGITVHLEQEQE